MLEKLKERLASLFSFKDAAYAARLKNERRHFKEVVNVHDLPDIYHYWSGTYLQPLLSEVSISSIEGFYQEYFLEAHRRTGSNRFLSVGSGNCDFELTIFSKLKEKLGPDFTVDCLELNPAMLARGRAHAGKLGLTKNFAFVEADFNTWSPKGKYAAVMAHHSLHHVVNLEHLFTQIETSLLQDGYFLSCDMIGRNGHQRWPEVLEQVHHFWKGLPDEKKYNHLLKRHEDLYENWDCSSEGFEGIRAQDILPLLCDRFNFELFVSFGGIPDIFIDRAFGHNFSLDSAKDRAFIDTLALRNQELIKSGTIKPTQMIAAMTIGTPQRTRFAGGLTPRQAIRVTN